MNDIMVVRRSDLVEGITDAVTPLKAELAECKKVRDQWCKEYAEQRDDANALAVRCAALETALRYWMPSKPSTDDRRDWKGDYAMAFGGSVPNPCGVEMKTGPKCDTLFSDLWNGYVATMPPGEFEAMTKYNLMRWAFREGFQARGKRDRKARSQSETGGKDV